MNKYQKALLTTAMSTGLVAWGHSVYKSYAIYLLNERVERLEKTVAILSRQAIALHEAAVFEDIARNYDE